MNEELTTGEAAKELGVSRRYISRLVHDGAVIPLRRVGANGMYLLARADVERLKADKNVRAAR